MAEVDDLLSAIDAFKKAGSSVDKVTKQYEVISPDLDWIIENKVQIIIVATCLIFISSFLGSYLGTRK